MNSGYQDMSLFDFIVLCIKKLKALCVWLCCTFRCALSAGRKYWYIVIILMILGGVYAHFGFKQHNLCYKGEAIILFPQGMRMPVETGLKLFIHETPADKGLTEEQSASIRDIYCKNVIDAKCDGVVDYVDYSTYVLPTDSLQDIATDRVMVVVELTDETYYPDVQKALCLYLGSRDEYAAPAKRWRESLTRRVEFLDNLLQNSDSSNVALFEQRELLIEKLAATPDVINFQTRFLVQQISESASKTRYLLLVLAGFLLGLLISSMIEYRKEIHDYFQLKR